MWKAKRWQKTDNGSKSDGRSSFGLWLGERKIDILLAWQCSYMIMYYYSERDFLRNSLKKKPSISE
jgi:hypothetical protein